MRGKSALRPSILCGILLLLVLAVTFVLNDNPIGFSKNALFQTKTPDPILQVQGKLAWAGGDFYYNYHKGNLKKISQRGKVLWDLKLNGKLLWMGPEGIIVQEDNLLSFLDDGGHEMFQKSDLSDVIRILCVRDKYLLLSGQFHGKDHGILLTDSGNTMWQLPLEGSIISGSVHPKGLYGVFNIIDENVKSKLVVIGATGQILIDNTYSEPLYQVEATPEGIGLIAGDRAIFMDYKGQLLWEHKFNGEVLRGDIGSDGFTTVVVKEKMGNLSQDVHYELIMLSRSGKKVCSYSLDTDVNLVDKYGDFIYIVDNYGIMILSREGLLVSSIRQKGIKELEVTDKNYIIAVFEDKSALFESAQGGILK